MELIINEKIIVVILLSVALSTLGLTLVIPSMIMIFLFAVAGLGFVVSGQVLVFGIVGLLDGSLPTIDVGIAEIVLRLDYIFISWFFILLVVKYSKNIPFIRRILYIWLFATQTTLVTLVTTNFISGGAII